MVSVGASHLYLRFYSLRRGGATDAFRRGVPLDTILKRGRWSDLRTARIYLFHGLQKLKNQSLSPNSLRTIRGFCNELASILR